MIVEKLSRRMEAWQLCRHELPADVARWVFVLPGGLFAVVSPNPPHHSVIATSTCWVVRTEVGCLYAVSDADFGRKYRSIEA
jgi:hypothetical protein